MKSLQLLKRGVSGVVAAVAVAAMVSIPSPALADPDPTPDTASEALKAYEALKRKAEKLNEAHLRAQDDLEANRKKMRQAKRALAAAQKAEQRARADVAAYRKVVDKFTSAAYRGSRLTSVAAALTGDSVRDYLDRAATIDLLAAEKAAALKKLNRAVEKAEQAQREALASQQAARKAEQEAKRNLRDIEVRGEELQKQIDKAREAYERLSGADRAALEASYGDSATPPSTIKAPSERAQIAVDAAMSKRGSPYVYGAEGPDAFDCSGLTSWAYQQAGISIPRSSSAQSQSGTAVPRDQLAPGDLVFFYSPVSHVGMYIGDGLMVHAPQQGDVVKVAPVMWNNFVGARRYA
ncbi:MULTISPECIES: C40 family peptidase [Thermocrispum]|uniref:NlpC/P60 family protein n=1 Tax=Thermocrispum agreste TaxID=37925 RepID=A0ABD6FE32_9PSEU|nr:MULTISPECIES: C40 family peptidase [Thermocrispum]